MFRHYTILMPCALYAITTVSGLTITKRDDDVSLQSLVSLVQQQAATIQGLQARVTSLENSVQVIHSTDQAQSQSIHDINDKLGKRVAFSAYMSRHNIDVGPTSPFVFDVVVTNVGNGYSQHTGVFTAPYDGIYVFQFIMLNYVDSPTLHAAIVKNGQVLVTASSDGVGTYNLYDDGSALVTTHLTKGDQVYVRRLDIGTKVNGDRYTNFSGFLISADS